MGYNVVEFGAGALRNNLLNLICEKFMLNVKLKNSYLIFLIYTILFLFTGLPHFSFAQEATLTVSQNSLVSSIGSTVFAPSNNLVDFNYFSIINNADSPVTIDMIKVSQSGGGGNDFARVSLFSINPDKSRGSQIGTDQYFSGGTAYFPGLGLYLGGGASTTIAISAVVNGSATQGTAIGIDIADGGSIYPAGSNAPAVSGSVPAVLRTVDKGQVTTTPPGAATGVTVTQTDNTPTLQISWSDPADPSLSKINLYRSTVQGLRGILIYALAVSAGVTPYTVYDDQNISVNTSYYYTLETIDSNNSVSTNTVQYLGTVYPEGLNIFIDSTSPAAQNLAVNSTNNTLVSMKFLASMNALIIKNLSFSGLTNSTAITNYYLYVDNAYVASSSLAAPIFYNNGTELDFAVNSSHLISIKGDIPGNAPNGAQIALGINGMTVTQTDGTIPTVYGRSLKGNVLTIVSSAASAPSASPTPTPSQSPMSSPSPAPSGQIANLPDGAMIRAIGGIDVYIIKYVGNKKFKRLILSPSVFNHYGHLKWSDIHDVDQSVLDAFTTSDLVRAVDDPKVYELFPSGDTGQKRWVVTADAFLRMGFDWDAIYEINSFDRDSYVTGADLQ